MFILIVIHAAISFWIAYAAGKAWEESKVAGGFSTFFIWMNAIASAVGFTWVYASIGMHFLDRTSATVRSAIASCSDLGNILVIPMVLLAIISIQLVNWARYYQPGPRSSNRNETLLLQPDPPSSDQAEARVRQHSPWWSPHFFSHQGDGSGGGGGSDDKLGIVLLVVFLALLGGVITTRTIILEVAKSSPLHPSAG